MGGVLKPALPLLFSTQTPTLKNLLKHTHSLSHAHSSTIGSSPTFLSASHFLVSFLHHPSRMVPAKPVLLAVLCPFLLCLLSTTIELVQCSSENKLILSLNEFQWKHNGGPPSCLSHKSRRLKGATILEMKHRDYCSGKKITDWNKKLQRRLILDDVHVRSLQLRRFRKKVSVEESEIQIPLTSGVEFQTLNYIVTVELGGKNMSVIVDTGSDLTWVQCEPCKLCYNQPEPIFKPSSSPSYQSVLCNSSSCQSLVFATGNYGLCLGNPPTCNYAVTYGDGSYTRGDLGSENLNLGASPSVKDFVFGCGRDNRGLFGGASGLMGLAKSSLSVVSQTSSVFGGIFSYCLPSTETGASGSFVMGGDSSAYKNKTPISYTKMVPNQELPTFYFLNLTRISVGGVALLEASCTNSANNKGGILIDSGTVITRLGPSIYKALKEEFLKQFSGYPRAPGFSILDTCFNLSGYEEVNIPTLTMHFEGDAEMKIDVTGIFYMVKTDASQVCLALASLAYDDEFCIIGNYQQKNQRVIYNTKDSELGFAGEACSFE